MSDLKLAYDSPNQTISIASGDEWRSSDAIDNSTNCYVDAYLSGSFTVNTTTPIVVYAFGAISGTGGSTGFTGGLAESIGIAWSAQENRNLFIAGTIDVATGSNTYEFGPWSMATVFNGWLPRKWGILLDTRSMTNLTFRYQGVYYATS